MGTRAAALAFAALLLTSCRPGASTRIAAHGQARMPVVIGQGASPRVEQAAHVLANYLGRITGATFEVVRGDGQTGLAVGQGTDFPLLSTGVMFSPADIPRREEYLLHSHAKGLYLLGATDLAVEDAVWDFLHRIGYRQYFPGPTWEVVPTAPDLSVALHALEKPAFYYRRIWYGFGVWADSAASEADWKARNRMTPAFNLAHGHAFDAIYGRKKAIFDAHPEYLAQVAGKRAARGGQKFCLSNPGVRRLLADFAMEELAAHPETECVSMDPSDGGGWCECDACKAMGGISDRVVTVANEVARAINAAFGAKYGAKYVGINIYNEHSAPPTIRADRRIIGVSTTAFIGGNLTHDQVVRGWQERGATVGVYDYFSVLQWDWDMPGTPGASQPEALAKNLKHYYDMGARIFSAESSDNWGPSGLGYYVASRVLWNPAEAQDVAAIRREFLTNCFGAARPQMEEFYKTIDGRFRPMLSVHLLGRMYRQLQEARQATTDPKALARIAHLILYTREQEIYNAYRAAKEVDKNERREPLLRFMYRMHATRMAHTYGMSRALTEHAKDLPANWKWTTPEDQCPWKDKSPFTDDEINALARDGIKNNRSADFDPVYFSADLVPAAPLRLPPVPTTDIGDGRSNVVVFEALNLYTWVDHPPATIAFTLTGHWFYNETHGYTNHARVQVFAAEDPTGEAFLDDRSIVCDKQPHELRMKTAFHGLHRVLVGKGYHGGCRVAWPDGMPMTLVTSTAQHSPIYGYGTAYFYVPKGTRTLGGYVVRAEGEICDADGAPVAALKDLAPKKTGYFSIPVPPGQEGRLWKLNRSAHFVVLLTVPACLARNASELLLPREVVAADASGGNGAR